MDLLTPRDIVNFLSGRDIMTARQVDAICQSVKENPQHQETVAYKFNELAIYDEKALITSGPVNALATAKVMQRPEFSDVKDHLLKTSRAINAAAQGLLQNEDLAEALKDNDYKDASGRTRLFAQMKPEDATLLVCDPEFMDPLIELKNMKPVDPAQLKKFEDAVDNETRKLMFMEPEEFNQEQQKVLESGNNLSGLLKPSAPGRP